LDLVHQNRCILCKMCTLCEKKGTNVQEFMGDWMGFAQHQNSFRWVNSLSRGYLDYLVVHPS
jgi:hypothetical protein